MLALILLLIIKFLSSNSTIILQPFNSGMIKPFKSHPCLLFLMNAESYLNDEMRYIISLKMPLY